MQDNTAEVAGLKGKMTLEHQSKYACFHAYLELTNVSAAAIAIADSPKVTIQVDAEEHHPPMSGPMPLPKWIDLRPGQTHKSRCDMPTVGVFKSTPGGWKQLAVGGKVVKLLPNKEYTISCSALPCQSSNDFKIKETKPSNAYSGGPLPLPDITICF